MTLWLSLLALAGVSALLTWILRRYAVARSLIDIPNLRSSHTIPTPRGGGASIVVTFLLVLPFLAMAGWSDWPSVIGLLGSGLLITIVGFRDDHGSSSVLIRLLVHFIGAAWLLFWLPELPILLLFGVSLDLGWAGYILLALFLVWMLNLFNFMDGIDGLAGVEAICASLGGALLYVLVGHEVGAITPLVLAAVVSGFLCWNFPPARIFMGDVGSGFLGITLGALVLHSALYAPELFWAWLILLGVFIVDATFTLLRRMLQRAKFYEAHRTHAYQYAARRLESHRATTLAVLLINACWLLPWACSVALGYTDGLAATVMAYVPLVGLAIWLNAGKPEGAAS